MNKQTAYASPLIWLLKACALLPLSVLYPISDILAWTMRHIVRYRLNVVRANLSACFPNASDADLRHIERDFYRNFADYFVETIKLLHISDAEMRQRMVFENIELVDSLFDKGKSIVAYFSHCGNWEWAPSITLWSRHYQNADVRFAQVYRPLKAKWADSFFLKLRSRFGSVSFPKRSVFRDLIEMRRDKIRYITGFMSDQKPSHGDPTLVLEFLNRPTAMITGTETLARKLDTAVIYFDMYKTSRGHYKIILRPIADSASTEPQGDITRRYAELLSATIERNPAIWLWSHKRWKKPVTLPETPKQLKQ